LGITHDDFVGFAIVGTLHLVSRVSAQANADVVGFFSGIAGLDALHLHAGQAGQRDSQNQDPH
jgi:hypothetical protein